jgi:arylsulfatase A-like enzyme
MTAAGRPGRRIVEMTRHAFFFLPIALIAACAPAPDAPNAPADSPAAAQPGVAASPANGPVPQAGNVAIIVLDACRADKLGCYGFGRPTSPNLDAFAADPDVTLFARHYVQGAWTKPSVASLFSGAFVKQHGVVLGNKDVQKKSSWREVLAQVLSSDYDTLAERMKRLGYRTIGIVKSYHLSAKYGFAQGFDSYDMPDTLHSDPERIDRFLELASQPGPFFAYIHLNACHLPFEAEDRDPDYMARYAVPYDERARRREGVDFTTSDLVPEIQKGRLQLTEADRAYLNLIYEAKLRRVDETLVSRLLDGMRGRGLYDSTLLLVTADHGEQLYDHASYGHGDSVWEEIVHVPLLVKFPKGTRTLPARVEALTQAVDLLPAITAWASGADRGAAADELLPGRRILQGEFGEWALGETKRDWYWTDGDVKAVGGRNSRFFRLSADPLERDDLFSKEMAAHRDASARVEEIMKANAHLVHAPESVEMPLDPQEEENLRSLGYIK